MRLCRAVILALLALSIAAFPLARGMAHVLPQHAEAAADMECCHKGEPCEKKTNDCDSNPACVLKCSSLPGTLAAASSLEPERVALSKPSRLAALFVSLSDNPPLPPPRL